MKFLDFVANNTVKPERKLNNSMMLQSKDVIQNYSSDEKEIIAQSDTKISNNSNTNRFGLINNSIF